MKFIATFGLLLRGALLAACIPALSLPALGADTGTAKNGQEAQPIPAALRSAFYHALAKDAGAVYNIDKAGCAVLAKSKLGACFDRHGAHFTGAGSPLALRLVAFGRGGGELAAVGSVRPTFHGNRVTYAHGNLTEWWRVLPVGFEQGFTIAERPSGQGRLTLALAASQPSRHSGEGRNPVKKGIPTSGRDTNSHRRPASAGMTKKNNDNAIAWGKLRYGHLVVTDAGGRVVPATLTSKNNRILIAVNDAGAAYPLTVDPLVWIEQRVTADDGTEGDVFGESVALDGNTALIGADGVTVGGNSEQGAVYVFSKSGTVWTQTQRLTASDGAELDQFGWSVALDGTTALVEARDAMIGFDRVGAAYVFEQSGGVWSQTAKLTASDGALGDQFGFSVALDGTTALVAAEGAKVGPNFNQGAVYVFDASGGSWTQTAKITAGDGASNDQFGHSIALDGTTALVGAWNAEAGANILQGAAYVFEKSGSAWTQTAKLVASDGAAQDRFGSAVALDGTTALVGAFVATVSSEDNAGAAYVFEESGGAWAQTAKLVPSDLAEDFEFGYAVALDGGSALVSAPFAHSPPGSPPDVGIGAVYLFEESGGAWTQTARIVARTSAEQDLIQGFGWSVALDGAIALAGTPVAIIGGNGNQGAAFFYGARDFGLVVSAPATVGRNENYVSQTIATNQSSAISPPVTMTVTVPAAASFISANATQGSCLLQVSETAAPDIVICDLGPISGNAGTATANLTLKAMDPEGTIIANTARIANASPALTASAPTVIGGGNNAPVASNGTLTTEVNTAKSGTLVATDPDGDPLTFSIVAEPTHGSVTLDDASTGAYTYAPDTDYSGSDSFTFKANDGTTDSNTATISITVNSAANNPPVAEDGTLTTEVNTAKGGTLVATDPDGDPLTFSIVAQPEHGGVTLDDASTGAYTYTPDTNYSGSDSFTFKASDGVADSNTATISITVNSAANNPPVAEDGTLTTEVNT
ncbi:MAG: Ig-like domain-containing protein, partial [Gammaproteobacteria bacterium]|nr:Ig-like domain-containing protein [Gammaproteobacteria bacterium]